MKKNEFAEIKKMDMKALRQKVKFLKGEITNLIIDKNMHKIANLRLIKTRRDELAQVLTVLRQKFLIAIMEEKDGQSK